MNAGNKNASAAIHAIGEARHAPMNPILGMSMMAANARPIISKIPADIANTEKPIPCMQKRTTLTPVSGVFSSEEKGELLVAQSVGLLQKLYEPFDLAIHWRRRPCC